MLLVELSVVQSAMDSTRALRIYVLRVQEVQEGSMTKPTQSTVYRPWYCRLGDDGPQTIGWLIVIALLITACILKSLQ